MVFLSWVFSSPERQKSTFLILIVNEYYWFYYVVKYFANDLVENTLYGSSDIPLSSATGNQVTTSMDQDSQPTYQDPITNNGKI